MSHCGRKEDGCVDVATMNTQIFSTGAFSSSACSYWIYTVLLPGNSHSLSSLTPTLIKAVAFSHPLSLYTSAYTTLNSITNVIKHMVYCHDRTCVFSYRKTEVEFVELTQVLQQRKSTKKQCMHVARNVIFLRLMKR